MTTLALAQQRTGDIDIQLQCQDMAKDGYAIEADGGRWLVTGNNPRSCLWAVEDIKARGQAGKFTPRFSVRGINVCESLARHTPEQVEALLERMVRWRMNTLIVHNCYGYKFHADLINRRCREYGLDRVHYVQTALVFAGNAPIEGFARDEAGRPRTSHACNETRLCVHHAGAREVFRQGARAYFESDFVEPGSRHMLMDADGYKFCQCHKCRLMKPVDQWAILLEIALDEADRTGKGIEIEYLSYVWRYAQPRNTALLDRLGGIIFDTHQRFRWAGINEEHPPSPYSASETKVDERAAHTPLNKYLHDRLRDWRNSFSKRLYIFENLMIQGSISCPQPYTPQLLRDLDVYESLGVDGIVYEAFEPGIETFARQFDTLAEALWQRNPSYQPTRLETLCSQLQGNEISNFDYKNQFNVIGYLGINQPDAIQLLQEDGADPALVRYLQLLRQFLAGRTVENYLAIMDFVLEHRCRFDWMMTAFNLIRAVLKQQPIDLPDGRVKEFTTVDKLWDFQENMDQPVDETLAVAQELLQALRKRP